MKAETLVKCIENYTRLKCATHTSKRVAIALQKVLKLFEYILK